jgi:hypothetical protein
LGDPEVHEHGFRGLEQSVDMFFGELHSAFVRSDAFLVSVN